MKILIVVLSVAAFASAQQQFIDQFFNPSGLVQYNDWQPQTTVPNAIFNSYGAGPLQQFLPGQQFPLIQPVPRGQLLPPVPVPFPAQYPYAVQQPAVPALQLPQLPVPVPPFNAFQPTPVQFQMVRHGLPHSDAAAVSYSSLHYNSNPQTPMSTLPVVHTLPNRVSSPATPTGVVNAHPVAPVTPALGGGKVSVVKDIATFGTEYGTGADKSPVARYEAINAGSVHVAPLPGHTVDQKLVAPGTVDQKL